MNEELKKRLVSGAWIAFAGFLATVIGLTLEHIDAFELTQTQETIALIVGTAIISQITKALNTK